MKIRSGFIFCLVLATTLISCSSKKTSKKPKDQKTTYQNQPAAQATSHSPTGGQYAEQASFTTLKGKKISVSDFKGKVVLIDFWETWCKPCLASMPTLSKLQKKYPQKLKVLAVTPGFVNTKKDAQTFAKDHDYDITYVLDTNDLHKKLHVRGIPFKVFIGPNGKFIKKMMGSHGPKGDYRHIKKIVEKYEQ
jgi:thiol-disulfide isomerase/thioredoxin